MTAMHLLAAHAAESQRRDDPRLRRRAALAFLDTIACIVAGVGAPSVRHARAAAAMLEPGSILIPGLRETASPGGAAFVGGTAAHALDYDDVFEPGLTHASAVLVPALLSAAQGFASNRPGVENDLVDAFAVGLDAQAFLSEAVNYDHYARGWHSTATIGAPSAALAVARLLRLDEQGCRAAIGFGISLAAGSKRQFGSDAKPLHAGMAARAGVLAAILARSGATTAPELLDGEWGFADLYAGPGCRGFASARDPAELTPALLDVGLWTKPYPCCASTHRAIDAVLDLTAESAPDWRAVTRIKAFVSPVAAANLMYRRPMTQAQARFSMNHCVAAAALRGSVEESAFEAAAISDPVLLSLAERVEMHSDPDLAISSLRPEATRLVVHLPDGTKLERRVNEPRGHPRRPLSDADMAAKFRACATDRLGTEQTEAALSALMALGERTSIVPPLAFLSRLVPPAATDQETRYE